MDSITDILAGYNIREAEDLQEAYKCLNKPEKWDSFMEQYIPPHLYQQFRSQLAKEKLLSIQQQSDNLIFQTYEALKEIDINISKVSVLPIHQYKWSQNLIDSIYISVKKIIQEDLNQSNTLQQYLARAANYIFDLLSRKGDLKEYFQTLKIINQQSKNKSELNNLLKKITFADFVILLIRIVKPKALLGSLLSQLAIPVPYVYEIQGKQIMEMQLCKDLMGSQKYSLILNIGSKMTSKCGKTSFIAKLMSLEQKNQSQSHFSNCLNFHTKFNFTRQQNVILADFNGQFSESLNFQIKDTIFNLSSKAFLLIIHLREQELLEKILDTKIYEFLCSFASKILIYVRDLQKTSLKILNRCIPSLIKQKTIIRGLKNFKKQHLSIEDKEQLTFICNNQLNVFHESKLSKQNLCSEHQRMKMAATIEKIESVMMILDNKYYTRKLIIPNTCLVQQLSEITKKMNEQTQSVQRMCQYLRWEGQLINNIKKPILTSFLSKVISIINFDANCIEILAQRLYEWKKTKIEPLRQQFLKLTEKLHSCQKNPEYIYRQILQNEQKRMQYEISIDTIIKELIFFNKTSSYYNSNLIVTNYYSRCINSISPINFIDGKTLQLGNQVLENYIISLSDKYSAQNKKLYVISVIGAQSSAKSTLLNFLFRCKFETSAGRCTKGVYLSLCQLDDMILVVLDTQGLLSVSERDVAFDHQIATFVLRVSNLIIINNKGELTSTLKQMLQVCLYVLECLHKDEKKTDYTPHKILFALRDQTKPKGKFQEEMAAQIKNSLQQMKRHENLDYKNFFTIQTEDILSLPNAFIQVSGPISKTGTMTMFDRTFQKCIMGMRKRIKDCLKSSNSQCSLRQFYHEASSTWQTIQKCGKEIMNFKSIHEILTKKKLKQKFQEKIYEFEAIIQHNYEEYFSKISLIKNSSQLMKSIYQAELLSIRQKNFGILAELFQTQSDQLCMNKEWIKEFLPKIQKLCMCYENINLDKYIKNIKRLKNKQKDEELKGKLNVIIINLLDENSQEQVALRKFSRQAQHIMEGFKKQKEQINRSKLQFQIKQIFENVLSLQRYAELRVNHIDQCQAKYKAISSTKNAQNFIMVKKGACATIEDYQIWKSLYINIDQGFQKQVSEYIYSKKIYLPSDVQNSMNEFLRMIAKAIGNFSRQINLLDKSYIILSIHLNETLFRIYLFGKLYGLVKYHIYEIIIRQHQEQQINYSKNILQYEQDLKNVINYRGNFKMTLKNDITIFKKDIINEKVQMFQTLLQNRLSKLQLRLNPETIFAKAMQQTILNNEDSNKKHYYIQCFKVVKNINRYLFEVMCNSPQISTRSANIVTVSEFIMKSSDEELDQVITKFESFLQNKQAEQNIKTFLRKRRMIGLANFQGKQINISTILESIIKTLKESRQELKDKISAQLKQIDCQKIMIKYIQGSLTGSVIGCQFCCPICGMKCMLALDHLGSHHVLQNCHNLAAFSGSYYVKTKEPVIKLCQQKSNILNPWGIQERKCKDLKEYIDKYHVSWSKDFPKPNEEHKFQKFAKIVKIKKIWANIQKAIIKTKSTHLIPSTSPEIASLRDEDEITDDDLQKIYHEPLTNKSYQLKDY